jgi:hypothetical protein
VKTLLALAAALVLASTAGAGELRVVEAVGAVPVVPGAMPAAPRDLAIQAGLREGVMRVGEELLLDAEPPEGEGAEARDVRALLDDALEGDVVRYTSRFRILEDKGERPVMFAPSTPSPTPQPDAPAATSEYVVVVEAHVDVERVRSRLVEAGLLEGREELSPEHVVVLVDLEGLDAWPAYAAVRDTLVQRVGAESVVPLGFERGRARLEVVSELAAPELLDRLLRSVPPELALEPLAAESDSLRLRVTWTPPPPAEEPNAVGSASPTAGTPPRN